MQQKMVWMVRMNVRKNDGYILIMAIAFLALLSVIGTRMYLRSILFFDRTNIVERVQRAGILAQSGLAYVQASLNKVFTEEEEAKTKKDAAEDAPQKLSPEARMLAHLLPRLGIWTTIPSPTEEQYQFPDEVIQVYYAVEQGKIGINQLFAGIKKTDDLTEKADEKKIESEEFKQAAQERDVLKKSKKPREQLGVRIEDFIEDDLFSAVERELYKKRYLPLNEVTEIITIKNADYFKKRMYVPLEPENKVLYLTDLFTIWSTTKGIDPWYLSKSLSSLLGLERVEKLDDQEISKLVKQYKSKVNIANDWDKIFKILYDAEFPIIKDAASLFSTDLTLPLVQVLINARVNSASVKLFAILEPLDAEYRIKKCYLL